MRGITANWFDPITRKRLQRFREYRRAYYSLLIIVFLYLTSLVAEVFCNDRPLYVHYQGKSYFPVLFFYPEDTFTGNGLLTRPDYKVIDASPDFSGNPDNYMVFPLVPFGPNEIIPAASVPVGDEVENRGAARAPGGFREYRPWLYRAPRAARRVVFSAGGTVRVTGMDIRSVYELPEPFVDALELRFANRAADPYSRVFTSGAGCGRRGAQPVTLQTPQQATTDGTDIVAGSKPAFVIPAYAGIQWNQGVALRATQYFTGCRVKPGMTRKEQTTPCTGCRVKPGMARQRPGCIHRQTAKSPPTARYGTRSRQKRRDEIRQQSRDASIRARR